MGSVPCISGHEGPSSSPSRLYRERHREGGEISHRERGRGLRGPQDLDSIRRRLIIWRRPGFERGPRRSARSAESFHDRYPKSQALTWWETVLTTARSGPGDTPSATAEEASGSCRRRPRRTL